jgi:hypothetical protein
MERYMKIYPAYDKRDPDPMKNHGIHGCTLIVGVRGPKGAVTFTLFTNWHLPNVMAEKMNRAYSSNELFLLLPMPADIGYHALEPQYKGQTAKKNCEHLGGVPCYYDGSGLEAEKYFDILKEKGSDGLYEALEGYYNRRFS